MGVLRFFSIFLKAYRKSYACAKTPQANLMAKWSFFAIIQCESFCSSEALISN